MTVTNPAPDAYAQYAAHRLSQRLQQKECIKLDTGLQDLCKFLDRDQGQALLKRVVANNTKRQNYLLFSIYKTNLSTSQLLPSFLSNLLSVPAVSYRTETIGALNNFQIYSAEEEQE